MDINTFGAMAAGMSTIDLYKYDPNGGPITRPIYPGIPPDYRNRITMSNGYLDWLTGDTAGIPYDNLSPASLAKWDKLDPFNVYNRSRDFATGVLTSAKILPF